MANGLPPLESLKKKPLPNASQLKKKDQPNATESPSTSAQGQSSLGSKPVPVDNSFLTKTFTPQDFGINTTEPTDATSVEVQQPIDDKSASLAVRDDVFNTMSQISKLDTSFGNELIDSEPFKLKEQAEQKASQLKSEIEKFPKEVASQDILDNVNSKIEEYNKTLSDISNYNSELGNITQEQDKQREPLIREMASKMSLIYPNEEFITEVDGQIQPTKNLIRRVEEEAKKAINDNDTTISEITGYSIIDAPLSSFNKMFYNTVKIPFGVASTMSGETNEAYDFLNDQALINKKINTDVKAKQLTQEEIEGGIIENTLKGNYKAAATNLGIDVLNTIPQVFVAAYSPSVYLNNTGKIAVGQVVKSAIAPKGLAYKGVSTGVLAMSAEKSEESYNQAIEDGLNPAQATALSTFKGLTTVLAESFFTKDLQAIKGTNAGVDLAKEIIKNKGKAVKDIIKQYPKQFADAGGEEMFEEMSENTLDAIADYLSTGKPINPYEIADASLVGLVSGGGASMVGNTKSLISVIRTDPNILKLQKQVGDIDRYIENNELTNQQVEALEFEKKSVIGKLNKYTNESNELINSMTDEDKDTYIETSQELAQKLDVIQGLPDGDIKDNMKEKANNLLDSRTELLDKYKNVEAEVVQEAEQEVQDVDSEQDMFNEDELTQLENEIAKAERIDRDRKQPERKPKPKQISEPQQSKPVFALEMIGETFVNKQGVVGTIKEENGGVIWESEDGTQIIDGGGSANVDKVTVSDMMLSFPKTEITEPIQLTEGELAPKAQLRINQAKREELELMTEIELEDAIAKAEKDVAEFEAEVTQEAAKQAQVDRLIFPIGGKKFAVRQKPDGTFAVSQENDKGKFVGIKDGDARKQAIDEYNNLKKKKESDALSQAIELSEEFKKEQDDKILNWLDNAISATSSKGRVFDATLGLPMFVANSSLKIVKAAYKAGKSLNEAIQDGLKYLKDNGYTVNELDFKKYVLEEGRKKPQVEPQNKKKPTPKPKETKATVSNNSPNNSLRQVANNFKDGESFAKQVRESLKQFKGKFKESQVKSIAIKAQKVQDQSQLDSFLEYANKVFENANYQNDLTKAKKMAKSARSKFRKANKAVGNQSFKYAISLKPEDLSNKDLERYREFLSNVNNPFFNESEFIDEIDYFADKYEITESKSVEAGEKAIENKNKAQDDLIESIDNAKSDPQSKVIRSTDEVLDTILNLSENDIRSLSKKDAYTLISAMQHSLDETPHTNEMYVVVRRFESKSIEESLRDILGSIKTKKLFRDIFRTGSKETIKNYIEKNPFKNIGLIAKGIEQTGLYKTLIQPIAIAYSSYLGRFRSYQGKVDKIYKKNKLKTIDDIKIHIVGLAKQKALNPKAKELSSIEDVMSAIEIEVGRNESFKKQGEEFIAAYKELLGNSETFNWEDSYNSLSKGAKEAFDFIEMHHTDMQPLVAEAAARNGEGTIVYDYYSPINVLYTSASDLGDIGQEANKFMSGNGTVSKSVNLKNRKQNNSVILLGAKDSSLKSTNSILRNYYVREPLVTLNNALNKIIKDENVKGQTLDFAKAIDASIKQTVTRLFENTHYEGSAVEKFSENLAVKGALRDLVSVSRAAVELVTNGIFAAFYSPVNSLKGLEILSLGSYNGQKIQNIDLMDMAVKVATTQFSRIFQGESGSPRQERENLLMKTGSKLEQIGNAVLSKADNLIAKPMWVGNFIGEFEKITGEKLNIKELNTSAEYYAKHKEAINQARDIADDRLAQGFSSMNPFESVAYAQVSRNRKVLDVFDKYFIRFRIGEFASVAKAINNLVYGGEMSAREASALIVATFARMSLYNFAILKTTSVAGAFIAGLMGIDVDDEEKDKESLERQIGNSLLSSALTLLLFRRLGNLGSAALTLGVEYMNMEKGFDLGLREKEEYNNFSDSYLYHPTISSLRLGQDYKGGEMMGINIVASLSGPYNKYIKNLGEVAINIKNGGLTIPNPMGEDVELIEPSYKDEKAIKRANNKAAKSGTDLLISSLGIPFSRDIANIWGYLNYEKYKDKKKKGGSTRPARPNLPKPIRPSRLSN